MRRQRGMTVLELMIVMAIVVLLVMLASSGLRRATKADLTDDALELASVLRRTGQLAIETSQLHRVVLDLDKRQYTVEVCRGSMTLVRGKQEARPADPRDVQDKLVQAQQRLATAAPGATPRSADPDDANRRAAALAGHHVMDRLCEPAPETPAPGATAMPVRTLHEGVKLREVWVQHLDEVTTSGFVAIHFFPIGAAEKAVIEVGHGDEVFTILIHGLSGRIEVKDEPLRNADDHMLRNARGDKEDDR